MTTAIKHDGARSVSRRLLDSSKSSGVRTATATVNEATVPPAGMRFIVGLILVVVASVIPYVSSYGSPFLNWDDPEYLINRPEIHHGFSWNAVAWCFETYACANWHPVTWLSYLAEVEFFGLNPAAMHVTNICLHAINTLLVALVVRALTERGDIAIFSALFFGIHPQHVEVVAWLSERKELLSTTFGLLSLLTWKQYRDRGGIKLQLTSLVWFALSLLSKQMLITLPFLLLVLEVCPMKPGEQRCNFRQLVPAIRRTLPYFALAAFFTIRVFQAQGDGGTISSVTDVPVWIRLSNAIESTYSYLWQTFLPIRLHAFYRHPMYTISHRVTVGCLAVLIAAGFGIWTQRNRPAALAGTLWFLGTLVPVLGLIQLGSAGRADRYMYFPHIGLFMAVGVMLPLQKIMRSRLVAGIAISLTVTLIGLCWQQTQYWKSSVDLWSRCLSCDPDNFRAHELLALAYLIDERLDEALKEAEIAIQFPENRFDGTTYTTLGSCLLMNGDIGGAIINLREAIRLTPHDFRALTNLGYAMRDLDLAESKRLFTEALKYSPENVEAMANLANCESNMGNFSKARELLRNAIKLNPDESRLRENLRLLDDAEKTYNSGVSKP